jgi:hypothetical protein
MTAVRTAASLQARPADTGEGSELLGNGMECLVYNLHVLVAPYKLIVGRVTPVAKREATWPTNSVSLNTGEHERSRSTPA